MFAAQIKDQTMDTTTQCNQTTATNSPAARNTSASKAKKPAACNNGADNDTSENIALTKQNSNSASCTTANASQDISTTEGSSCQTISESASQNNDKEKRGEMSATKANSSFVKNNDMGAQYFFTVADQGSASSPTTSSDDSNTLTNSIEYQEKMQRLQQLRDERAELEQERESLECTLEDLNGIWLQVIIDNGEDCKRNNAAKIDVLNDRLESLTKASQVMTQFNDHFTSMASFWCDVNEPISAKKAARQSTERLRCAMDQCIEAETCTLATTSGSSMTSSLSMKSRSYCQGEKQAELQTLHLHSIASKTTTATGATTSDSDHDQVDSDCGKKVMMLGKQEVEPRGPGEEGEENPVEAAAAIVVAVDAAVCV